ncbi:hypothetical protein ACFCV8_08355 [Streptomyces sp. NPDC056347]|uniref:hypothetical protein n=1 Tax=Streptomyces sp. NPDC056347 TaxID=3345790 RepID=UPI0035DE97BF
MKFNRAALGLAGALGAVAATLTLSAPVQAAQVGITAASPTVSPSAERTYLTSAGLSSCDRGRYCTETLDPAAGNIWRVHVFYECKTYALSNWMGTGSHINNQTDGVAARVYDKNMKLLWSSPADNKKDWENWTAAYYIKPC